MSSSEDLDLNRYVYVGGKIGIWTNLEFGRPKLEYVFYELKNLEKKATIRKCKKS